ncbi:MAG: CotH kinase family protein, partial [Paludibacteraceae bacterium]|nr:CotH kinase family protein [Paludibacteraceae bacterium]
MKKLTTLFLWLFISLNMLAANVTLYFVNSPEWTNVHAYAWKNSTQTAIAEWPGTAATLEPKTMNGYEVYSYTFDNAVADRIIFNKGAGGTGNQTDDLIVDSSKPYYYNNRWNASITYDASSTSGYCIAGAAVEGTNWCCGTGWSADACPLTDNTASYSALPAGEYKFKITDGTWSNSWGYSALTSTTGFTKDADNNVVITLAKASDVTIVFNSSTKKITVTVTEATPIDPTQPTATIAAIRNRLSINTNDFTDFAGLYVAKLPTIENGELSAYAWEFSTDNASWSGYEGGDGANWDNIRPNKAGYYRCVLTYNVNEETQTVYSNTLQISNKGGSTVTFSSNLPVVLVRTAKDFPTPPADYPTTEQVAELKAKRSVDVKILWNENGGNITNNDINNASVLHYDRKARMNYRGSSSLNNPKKSFAFVTGDKNCDAKKLGEVKTKKFAMFDGDAHKDWVLYASYPDATFMRNILSYHQYAQMTGLWGVKCRYVEMYIDGEYQGIYVFMDKMTQDETRINVNEDTGYIVRFDKTDMVDRYDGYSGANEDYKRCTFITSNTGKKTIATYNMQVDQAFEIEYPEREDIATFDDDGNVTDDTAWEKKVSDVKAMFVNMESAILANDYDKLATLIDYQSWADWFIINEFTKNADAYRISCVFQINSTADKIVANPIWDYELGLGNQDTKTSGLMVEDNTYYLDDFPTPFWWTGKGKNGCNGILGDCKFKAMVKERWAKHIGTNGALNATVLNAKIDSLANVLSQGAGSREKSKWNTYSASSTSTLKSWITSRTSALNSIINDWEVCGSDTPDTPDVPTPTTTYYMAGAQI